MKQAYTKALMASMPWYIHVWRWITRNPAIEYPEELMTFEEAKAWAKKNGCELPSRDEITKPQRSK